MRICTEGKKESKSEKKIESEETKKERKKGDIKAIPRCLCLFEFHSQNVIEKGSKRFVLRIQSGKNTLLLQSSCR
jgi:hypothetical protein